MTHFLHHSLSNVFYCIGTASDHEPFNLSSLAVVGPTKFPGPAGESHDEENHPAPGKRRVAKMSVTKALAKTMAAAKLLKLASSKKSKACI